MNTDKHRYLSVYHTGAAFFSALRIVSNSSFTYFIT